MSVQFRITHLGMAGRLNVYSFRQDEPHKEPHSLRHESELAPGESRQFRVYPGNSLVISEPLPEQRSADHIAGPPNESDPA